MLFSSDTDPDCDLKDHKPEPKIVKISMWIKRPKKSNSAIRIQRPKKMTILIRFQSPENHDPDPNLEAHNNTNRIRIRSTAFN